MTIDVLRAKLLAETHRLHEARCKLSDFEERSAETIGAQTKLINLIDGSCQQLTALVSEWEASMKGVSNEG